MAAGGTGRLAARKAPPPQYRPRADLGVPRRLPAVIAAWHLGRCLLAGSVRDSLDEMGGRNCALRLCLIGVGIAAGACGAGAREGGTTSRAATAPPAEAPKRVLNATQLACRDQHIATIRAASEKLVQPGCASTQPAMERALDAFDGGTTAGWGTAKDAVHTVAHACLCQAMPSCTGEPAVQARADVEDLRPRDARARNNASREVTDALAKDRCADAAIGVELVQLGYACAYGAGLSSQELRNELDATVVPALDKGAPGERERAEQAADACWSKVPSVAPPAK